MARVTYEEAVMAAGQILADACARMARLTPEQAALEAYVPGGPSVEELAERIRTMRERAARQAA